jgi:hypothetical protein
VALWCGCRPAMCDHITRLADAGGGRRRRERRHPRQVAAARHAQVPGVAAQQVAAGAAKAQLLHWRHGGERRSACRRQQGPDGRQRRPRDGGSRRDGVQRGATSCRGAAAPVRRRVEQLGEAGRLRMGEAAAAAQLLRCRRQRGLLQNKSRHDSLLSTSDRQSAAASSISVQSQGQHLLDTSLLLSVTHLQLLLRVLLGVLLRLLLLLLLLGRSSRHIRCGGLGEGGGRHALAPGQHLQHALLDGTLPAHVWTPEVAKRIHTLTHGHALCSCTASIRPCYHRHTRGQTCDEPCMCVHRTGMAKAMFCA